MLTTVTRAFIAAISLIPISLCGAAPVDDLRIVQLEQELRELQQRVQQQSRRIEALEAALSRSRIDSSAPVDRGALKLPTASNQWLEASAWDRIRTGMSESEVLKYLGTPSSARRAESGARILFYAMELDAGGFLSGQVIFRDDRVAEVRKPSFK